MVFSGFVKGDGAGGEHGFELEDVAEIPGVGGAAEIRATARDGRRMKAE